ncbi:hypothetical protein GC194_02180 [bacterium]|nr:hypothetical protein [bacterium]
MPYPSTSADLRPGHSYAWQVQAWVGSYKLGVTQVWSFKVVELSKDIVEMITRQDYFELGTQGTRIPVSVIKEVKFKMSEENSRGEVLVNVFDVSGKNLCKKPFRYKNRVGLNYHKVDLQKIRTLKHKEQYILIFTNPDGKVIDKLSIYYLDPYKM